MHRLGTPILFVALCGALAACGGSSSSTVDAPMGAIDADPLLPDAKPGFECLGQPLPTTAPAMVTVSGLAETVSGTSLAPLAGATIDAYVGTSTTSVATTTSGADGKYSISLSTGGAPTNGYLKGSKSGDLDTYLYPPAALSADTDKGTMLIVDSNTITLLAALANVTQDPQKTVMAVIVADCANTTLAGATVSISPAGTSKIIYATNNLPSRTATSTDVGGLAFIFNVTPGDVTVDADVQGMSLREHTLNARANAVTTTVVQP